MVEKALSLGMSLMNPPGENLRDRLQHARVLVVGDAMLDRYLFGEVERISPEAPVPVVRVTREEERLGGGRQCVTQCEGLSAHV